ncbi:putative oxidoreductase [Colletotrichum shisoi]|uniref:Putative oxidoreductase n=1 Tax=Colletotrichum shisoi TaxID=2078593 RepID=A0A5Q4BXI2_9PEZI|nr:putative oxidoreductase [Colletotrichum shisoi]
MGDDAIDNPPLISIGQMPHIAKLSTGTLSLLEAAKKYGKDFKRAVITSSFAAILDNARMDDPNTIYTEESWNPATIDHMTRSKDIAYPKPLYTLSTIDPPLVLGPLAHPLGSLGEINTSNFAVTDILSGKSREALPNSLVFDWADVRDVAFAHVSAVEKGEAASQRFLTTGGRFCNRDIVEIVQRKFPEHVDRLLGPDIKGAYPFLKEQNALNRVFREVERATRAHYEDVARQAQQQDEVELETGRGTTISVHEDDSDFRRLLRGVPRKSYASHPYESEDEGQPDDGDHESVFGSANQDSSRSALRVPNVLPVDRAIQELRRLEEAQAAASRRLGEATWLGMKRGTAPGPETLVQPVYRMPGNSNPQNYDQMRIQGAIDQVERANAARELAFQQLGKVVYAMELPAGLPSERDQPESQG